MVELVGGETGQATTVVVNERLSIGSIRNFRLESMRAPVTFFLEDAPFVLFRADDTHEVDSPFARLHPFEMPAIEAGRGRGSLRRSCQTDEDAETEDGALFVRKMPATPHSSQLT